MDVLGRGPMNYAEDCTPGRTAKQTGCIPERESGARHDNPFLYSATAEEDVNLMAGVLGASRSGNWLTVPVGSKKAQRVRVIVLEENSGNLIHMPGEANCAIVIDERAAAKHSGRDVFFWCGTGNFDLSQARPVQNPDSLRFLISQSAFVLRRQREDEGLLQFAGDLMVDAHLDFTFQYASNLAGQPCPPSVTAKATDCIPADSANGSGGQPPLVQTTQKPSEAQSTKPPQVYSSVAGQQLAVSIFGENITPNELGQMAGALPGSNVRIEANEFQGVPVVIATVYHPDYTAERMFFRDSETGKNVAFNYVLATEIDAPRGTGNAAFVQQIETLRQRGDISEIRIEAARIDNPPEGQKSFIGYGYWPKHGYDAPIPQEHIQLPGFMSRFVSGVLPSVYRGAKTLLDLYDMPGGEKWWWENGKSVNMTLDLAPGSRGMKKFDQRKAAKK